MLRPISFSGCRIPASSQRAGLIWDTDCFRTYIHASPSASQETSLWVNIPHFLLLHRIKVWTDCHTVWPLFWLSGTGVENWIFVVFCSVCEVTSRSSCCYHITYSGILVQWEIHSESNLTTFPGRLNHRHSSPDVFFLFYFFFFCGSCNVCPW